MQIVTSSFFTALPADFARISIARWSPKGDRHLPAIRELAPGDWFKSVDEREYHGRYMAQLDALDPAEVCRRIEVIAGGRPAALLCWERPSDGQFCHRAFVSAWLQNTLGLPVPEFGCDPEAVGARHPKMPQARLI
jgi:hypothetical protein